MRARAAFVRAAAARCGGRDAAGALWDAAARGDQTALGVVASWLARDGLELPGVARSGFAATAHGLPGDFCMALARLADSLRRGPRGDQPIQPAQIVAARFGDFARLPDGAEGPGLCWSVRRCGWAQSAFHELRGEDLAAWRVVVKHGRTEAPAAGDLLLAPRGGDRPWDARAIRHAITVGRRAVSQRSGFAGQQGSGEAGSGEAASPGNGAAASRNSGAA